MARSGAAADGGDAPVPPAVAGAPERGREGELVGRVFDGKFLILRLIGVGGFGAVYSARDLQLETGVAIKVLHKDVAADEASLAGFLQEARRLTRLKHPNVVGWKALALAADGAPYFVMELLEGSDLLELLESERTIAPDRAARILLQIVDALRAAHRLPDGECLLHLDLKPSNVFLEPTPSGRAELDWVKVIDFGVSQFLGADVASAATPAEAGELPDDPGQTIRRRAAPKDATGAGAKHGDTRCAACTPEYCAPEQGAHLLTEAPIVALDERADLYAVGAIGFRMVTGRLPFERRADTRELLTRKLEHEAPTVESAAKGVPHRLARFIDRCLARDRERRFASAEEAYAELDAIANPRSGRRALAFASIVAALAATSGWLMLPRAAAPYFELFARDADHERILTNDVLTLGPRRRDAVLRVSGVDVLAGDALRVVSEPKPEAEALADWRAEPDDDNHVRISGAVAPERAPGKVRDAVYVEVRRVSDAPRDAKARWSQPFELEWLGPDAVKLVSADVPRREGRRLDPELQKIEVQVDGRPEDVERVWIPFGGHDFQAQLDVSRRSETSGVWVLALRGLGLTPATAGLDVHVADRAGNEEKVTCAPGFVTEPLAFSATPALTAAQRNGSRWFVADRRRAHLTFALNGAADVEVELFDAAHHSLGSRKLTYAKGGDVALADFAFEPGDRLFRGTLEVHADDGAYVLRDDAARRGCALDKIDFDCSDAHPQIAVKLSNENGANKQALAAEAADGTRAPFYSASRQLEVHLTQGGSVPLRVALDVDGRALASPGASADGTAGAAELALGGSADAQGAFKVALPSAGAHEIVVRCWRQIDADDRRRSPDLEIRARCVVDETAPLLACHALDSEERSNATGVWPAAASLVVDGGAASEDAAPNHVHFEVARAGRAAPSPALAEGDLPVVAKPGEKLLLPLPIPLAASAAVASNWNDGHYVLRLTGRDEAGNVAAPVELPFEIARTGPAIEVKRPLPGQTWDPDAAGSYELRADVEDENGVADVVARLEVEGRAPFEVALASEKQNAGGTAGEWSGRTRIPRSWTRRELTLTFTAHDRRGRASSPPPTKREADSITRSAPVAIRVQEGGAKLATLRLVRGNRDVPYRFGGRNDEDEKRLFAAVGLGSYNRLKMSRSWSAEFAAGEIGDYYLDDREVSVADFKAFLGDEHGWADGTQWPAGSAPDARRRAVLIEELRELPPDRPVADVTWNEAAAFARWAGKRLPSFVEWEYALRGGANYRPTASGRVVDPASGADDVTPDTKLRGLTGGVSEWSATTSDGFDGANPIRWVNDHRMWFLRPREGTSLSELTEFWVVGASSRRAHGDFACADRQPRDARAADRGFRCAASFDDVIALLESGDAPRARFTECGADGGGE